MISLKKILKRELTEEEKELAKKGGEIHSKISIIYNLLDDGDIMKIKESIGEKKNGGEESYPYEKKKVTFIYNSEGKLINKEIIKNRVEVLNGDLYLNRKIKTTAYYPPGRIFGVRIE